MFKLQIVDGSGVVATPIVPGDVAEIDLAQAIATAVAAKVSMVSTKAQVKAAVMAAVAEVIYTLKTKVKPA